MALGFGIAARSPTTAQVRAFAELVARVSSASELAMAATFVRSYEELMARFADGGVTIAWLPPLPFLALERARLAVPLVEHHRTGRAQFDSVFVARRTLVLSSPGDVIGKKVGWVEPLSTSGYVLPRIQLAARGVDPRNAFTSERFFGSHDAAVRAVVSGVVDLAATWAHAEPTGRLREASWTSIAGAPEVLHVAMSVGRVPADVTAARRALPGAARREIAKALLALGAEPGGAALLREALGVDEVREWQDASYDGLRAAIAEANAQGLLGAIDTLDLTRI
jgi:phosphate/phosphite/phosphonate ABC transporter binding protein